MISDSLRTSSTSRSCAARRTSLKRSTIPAATARLTSATCCPASYPIRSAWRRWRGRPILTRARRDRFSTRSRRRFPAFPKSLLPRRDIWGEPMPSRAAFFAPGVTAIYMQRMSHDPVNIAMNDLGMHPGAVERKIRGVQLTDHQYDDFARIAGRMTKMRLDAIVHSPNFRSWPNHIKRDVISEVLKQSREAARGMLMIRYPQIVQDAVKARLDKLKD